MNNERLIMLKDYDYDLFFKTNAPTEIIEAAINKKKNILAGDGDYDGYDIDIIINYIEERGFYLYPTEIETFWW